MWTLERRNYSSCSAGNRRQSQGRTYSTSVPISPTRASPQSQKMSRMINCRSGIPRNRTLHPLNSLAPLVLPLSLTRLGTPWRLSVKTVTSLLIGTTRATGERSVLVFKGFKDFMGGFSLWSGVRRCRILTPASEVNKVACYVSTFYCISDKSCFHGPLLRKKSLSRKDS